MANKTINIDCTTCVLDSGFKAPCAPNSPGGNDNTIFIIPTCYLDTISDDGGTGASAIVTGITYTTGSTGWYQIECQPDTLVINENMNLTTGSFSYDIQFQISALANGSDGDAQAAAARGFVDSISNPYEKFTLIATSNAGDGVRYIYGESRVGLKINDGTTFTSGTNIDELAGFTIALKGAGSIARVVSADIDIPTA